MVFIVFFSGERARHKITKICEAFGVNRYPFPEDAARQRQMKVEVRSKVDLQFAVYGKSEKENLIRATY